MNAVLLLATYLFLFCFLFRLTTGVITAMRDRNRKKTRKQGINITRLSMFCPAKVTIR